MLKYGIISDSKPGFAKVIFPQDDNIVTDWLPICVPFSLGDKIVWSLKINTQVACMMDEHCEEGIILGATYNDEDIPPNDADFEIEFEDGTKITYDKTAGELKANVQGKITALATGDIDIESSEGAIKAKGFTTATIEAPAITLKGAVTVEGVITAGGLALTPMPGVSGADGKAHGDINVTGSVNADSDVKAGTIYLSGHKHTYPPGSGGGITSTPV